MSKITNFIAIVVFFAALYLSRAQEPQNNLDARVRDLVRQLGDGEYSKREAARKALLELGTKIVPVIDKLPPLPDLETTLRLRKIRYQIVGLTEDLEKYLTALPAAGDPEIRPELTPQLKGVIASGRPKSGDLLLKYILDPKHPLQRRAVNALVGSFDHLTSEQIDAYLRHALVLESRARPKFPQKVNALVGMLYYCRYSWGGWPGDKTFELETKTTHYLDGKPYGAPFNYQGPMATTGWIRTKDLSEGKHTYHFTLEYEFTRQNAKTRTSLRSRDFTFEMLPPSTPDDLIAPASPELEKQVRENLRFIDRDPSKDELFLGQDHVVDPWFPQVSWQEGGKKCALRVPTWKVDTALSVDLCFESEILDVKTGKTYRAEPLMHKKGKTAYGYLCPDDVRAFAKDRSGFVEVQVRLTPSRGQALTDPDITRYYPGAITSKTLRMKIIHRDSMPDMK
jgi:hypothetical protein